MPSIISRYQWGARPAQGNVYTTSMGKRTGFVVHHSGADDDQTVKAIQNFHLDTRKWSDIGYNFLIDKKGRIYEGRGWDKIGAHVEGHNTANIGVCIIGNYSRSLPSDAALTSLRWLYVAANARKGATLKVYGHTQLGSTSCPGAKLMSVVRNKLYVSPDLPMPAPTPKPQAPKQNWTEKLMDELPTIAKGSRGRIVKIAQACMNVDGAGLKEDGIFGPATERETKEAQRKKGLNPDGLIGPKTWPRLVKG